MVHVLGGVAGLAAEQMAVDPEVAGLLLRQRVEGVARAERAQHAAGIGAPGMVALAAAAIQRKALAAVAIDQLAQPCRDLRNRRVPVDRLEAAVGAPAQRRGEPVAVMGIEGNPRGLVAEIALRLRIVAVAADLDDLAVSDLNLDAAIDVADIAGGLAPFWARHRVVLPDRIAGY